MDTRDGREIIWIVGFPKSGTTWLTRLVAEALNSPADGPWDKKTNSWTKTHASEGHDRKGKYYVIHNHKKQRDSPNKIIYITRDPRDIIVSAMYYWEEKSLLQSMGRLKGWRKRTEYWLLGDNADSYVTYEQLHEDCAFHVERVIREIGAEPVNIESAVSNQEFGMKSITHPEQGDHRFLRKGVVGDWKNHFNRKNSVVLHGEVYDLMEILGYENDPEWFMRVEE